MRKFISLLALTALLAMNAVSAFAETTEDTYSDVASDDIYFDAVVYLSDLGVVQGDSDSDTFRPDDGLNRAEMTKIIVEATTEEDLADFDTDCFGDVPAGEWYTPYVCYAKDAGWVVGYEGDVFRPAQNVTFVEGLKILLEGKGILYDAETDPWYQGPVDTASLANYIPIDVTGFQDDLRRDQMADMITRVLKMGEGTLDDYLGDRADYVVDYVSIEAGKDLYQEMMDSMMMDDSMSEYQVSFMNVSEDVEGYTMPISPGVLVTHDCEVSLVTTGAPASESLEGLAELGDPDAVKTLLHDSIDSGSANLYSVQETTELAPGESAMYTVTALDSEVELGATCVSYVAMAVGTNDALVQSKVVLSMSGTMDGEVMVYDAGTEENSDINSGFDGGQPDAAEGPEANVDNGTATDPWDNIMAHPQFEGVDPLMTVSVMKKMNIAETVVATGDLSTLLAALQAAELVAVFEDEEADYTVFAPTNAAFAEIQDTVDTLLMEENMADLQDVLKYHVVDGAAMSGDLTDGMTLTTLQGGSLVVTVDESGVMINGAMVTTADVETSNGVVHIIDTVLVP